MTSANPFSAPAGAPLDPVGLDPLEALRRTGGLLLRYGLPLAVVSFMLYLMEVLAIVLCILPGIYLGPLISLAAGRLFLACVDGEPDFWRALRPSQEQGWGTAAALAALAALWSLPMTGVVLGAQWWLGRGGVLVVWALSPVSMLVMTGWWLALYRVVDTGASFDEAVRWAAGKVVGGLGPVVALSVMWAVVVGVLGLPMHLLGPGPRDVMEGALAGRPAAIPAWLTLYTYAYSLFVTLVHALLGAVVYRQLASRPSTG